MTTFRLIAVCGVLLMGAAPAHAELVKQFENAFGTAAFDSAQCVVPAHGGGYLLVGTVNSDLVAMKVDQNGVLQWQRSYGDPAKSERTGGECAHPTADGGYILGGMVNPGPHGEWDGLLVKIDAAGNQQWTNSYGGPGGDLLGSIEATTDGGYVLTGQTTSFVVSHNDAFVVKVDSAGTVQWQQNYGQIGGVGTFEASYDVVQTPDGGYAVTGVAYGFPDGGRAFIVKTDGSGVTEWENVDVRGLGTAIALTSDGGYAVAGGVPAAAGAGNDVLLAKYDGAGTHEWTRTFGGLGDDFGLGLEVTSSGFAITGWRSVDALMGFGGEDVYLVETDADGLLVRESVFGGSQNDEGLGVLATPDGGYVLVGWAELPVDGHGSADIYLLKLRDVPNPATLSGTVWGDVDDTCGPSEGDLGLDGRMVRAVDGEDFAYYVPTGSGGWYGEYRASVPPGSYALSMLEDRHTTLACGLPQESTVSLTAGGSSGGNDFAARANCCADVEMTGFAPSDDFCIDPQVLVSPCEGYDFVYCATVDNCGTGAWGGGNAEVCFNLDPGMTATSATVCPSWTQTSANPPCFENTAGYTANASCTICVTASVTGIGPWTTSSSLTASCGQGSAGDTAVETDTSACACDPNDIQVSPEGCGADGAITAQQMTYTVRFQNLGAGPAHDVVVKSTLDADLDLGTFRLVETSHPVTDLQIGPSGELVVRFDGIALPAEIHDAAGSHGRLMYTIEPRAPFSDGTVVNAGAAIYFDANPPVITNVVKSTLYHGDPVPVADFHAVDHGGTFDFEYAGGTTGATFAWSFGADATPATSTDQNPTGVTFATTGTRAVSLTLDKAGCVSSTSQLVGGWSAGSFQDPMGKKKRLGSVLPVKFALTHLGVQVTSVEALEAILAQSYGWTPADGCWPRIAVYAAGTSAELPTDTGEYSATPDNPEECFRFGTDGSLIMNLMLSSDLFEAGGTYEVEVDNFGATLVPANNVFQVRN